MAKKVQILAFGQARHLFGWGEKQVDFSGNNIAELFSQVLTNDGQNLANKLLQNKKIKKGFLVLLNGKRIDFLNELSTPLHSADQVLIVEIVHGIAGG